MQLHSPQCQNAIEPFDIRRLFLGCQKDFHDRFHRSSFLPEIETLSIAQSLQEILFKRFSSLSVQQVDEATQWNAMMYLVVAIYICIVATASG